MRVPEENPVARSGSNEPINAQPDESLSRDNNNPDHLVILVHGFNTFARWMDEVKEALRAQGFAAEATGYTDISAFYAFFHSRLVEGQLSNVY